MSYSVDVTNNFSFQLTSSRGSVIPSGQATKFLNGSNLFITIPGYGPIIFLDLGQKHIPGDSGETWGVLITYQGQTVVGRWEGSGQLQATVNGYGQILLSGMNIREVDFALLLIP